MKACLLAVLVCVAIGHCQENRETRLTGTAINTTNPDNPIAAPIEIIARQDSCQLTVSLPLIGSGNCRIKTYDQKSGRIEIISFGQPSIVWSGTVKGNFARGTYKIDVSAQTGSFYLAILRQPQKEPPPPPAPVAPSIAPHRNGCVPAIETSISGEVKGWDGETIFKLENGEIWQQAEYDYTYFYEFNPDVTIYQTTAGCRMKVEGEDDTVIVKRIR